MKRLLILAALAAVACSGGNKKPMETSKDQLVHTLFSYAESGKIAYGHQDDLFYGHTWKVEDWENDALERSDVKAVTGKYPQILGCDLGGIELGADKNLDGIPFGLMRKAVLAQIERGGMVTFSWHPRNPLTGGDAWDISSTEVVKSVHRIHRPGSSRHLPSLARKPGQLVLVGRKALLRPGVQRPFPCYLAVFYQGARAHQYPLVLFSQRPHPSGSVYVPLSRGRICRHPGNRYL